MKIPIKSIPTITIGTILLAGMIGTSLLQQPKVTTTPVLEVEQRIDQQRVTPWIIARLNQELGVVRENKLIDLTELRDRSEARIRTIIARHRKQASSASRIVAEPFQGLKNTGHTGCLAAIDLATAQASRAGIGNIKPTSSLEDYTRDAMRPASRLVSSANAEIRDELEAHLAEASALINLYAHESMQVIESHGLTSDELRASGISALHGMRDEMLALAARNQSATLNTGFEAAFIALTYKSISSVLVQIARKLSSTAGAAAITAASDGPIPIMDVFAGVIAAGGLVWTGHDIYKAHQEQKALPGKIQRHIETSFTAMQSDAVRMIRKSCAPDGLPHAQLSMP